MKTAEDRKKLKNEAKSQASEIFAIQDEAQMQAKLQELIEESKTQFADLQAAHATAIEDNTKLTEAIETLKTEKSGLEGEVGKKDEAYTKLQSELESAKQEVEGLKKELDSIKRESLMKARVQELEEAGLLSSGKAADKQKARVAAMSDEEFADYKAELLDIVEARDKAQAGKKPEDNTTNPDGGDTPTDDLLTELDKIDETKITAAQLLQVKRAAAGLNLASTGGGLSGVDERGIDKKMLSDYEKMWDDAE